VGIHELRIDAIKFAMLEVQLSTLNDAMRMVIPFLDENLLNRFMEALLTWE